MNAADVRQTVKLWIRAGISAPKAWEALTGIKARHVAWWQVEEFMFGWLSGQEPRLKLAA